MKKQSIYYTVLKDTDCGVMPFVRCGQPPNEHILQIGDLAFMYDYIIQKEYMKFGNGKTIWSELPWIEIKEG